MPIWTFCNTFVFIQKNPRKNFVEVTSIGEPTWKLWHQWVLHVDFSMSFRRQIDVTSVLAASVLSFSNIFPNGHTTSNPRRFDVDITSIRGKPNFDEFPLHFRLLFRRDFNGWKTHVVSTYFFWCNFDGRRIHIVSTYFFRCKFDGQKIHVVSTCFYQCNFDSRNMHVVVTYFFRRNFDGQRFGIVFGKL